VKGGILLFVCGLCLAASARTVTAWRDGWTFRHFGGSSWGETAKEDGNAVLPDYDDSGWQAVRVPHDWGIGAAFDARHYLPLGGLPCFGTGVYRRRFVTGRAAATRLELDGAMGGATVDAAAIRRQIRILKEMGANAIRTAHNPPAPDLLRLCDEMGVMVLDEAFDVWTMGKCRHSDYAKHFSAKCFSRFRVREFSAVSSHLWYNARWRRGNRENSDSSLCKARSLSA